ncbi:MULTISPECIES: ArsR/SmtB family transcription factor [Bacillus cereus group]|uniref:ArsR/SmtB family transcription factor n=1 Tax=Bacillus cereus group TaxID=86661 RepID=UPI00111D5A8C|nr:MULTISPECIES: metalloregulator ArsR/SmtB family transcription factor [Bacillus cereus group]MDW3034979.1 metalloregulator ArsR/SmtB family transcription factor [Bacillus pacificus]MED0825405.1 metalloregulator ArsR/SmtB family transcription factor [Bacillus pacificus]TNP05830.1 winged helix-turn-helix transcriptional regulator [Bacillus pacificus]
MKNVEKLIKLTDDFKACQTVLTAIGDSTRQSIIITLIAAGCEDGMRVGEITRKTHLSRPAVSHHIKVLKDAKVVNVRRVATMNFYYIDPENNNLKMVKNLLQNMDDYIAEHWEPSNKVKL